MALVLQDHFSNPGAFEIIRVTHSCQDDKAHHVSHDVQLPGCNDLLVIRLLERDREAQDCRLKVHKPGVVEHNLGYIA